MTPRELEFLRTAQRARAVGGLVLSVLIFVAVIAAAWWWMP